MELRFIYPLENIIVDACSEFPVKIRALGHRIHILCSYIVNANVRLFQRAETKAILAGRKRSAHPRNRKDVRRHPYGWL